MSLADVLELVRCPVCQAQFAREPGRVVCAAGHAFDLARQGYLNLLGRAAPPNADTADMVAARSRFLGAGHFAPVAEVVNGLVSHDDPTVLDVGAGGGHYVSQLLSRRGGRAVALDISPAACRRAARAPGTIGAVVADAWEQLPLTDRAFDVVLSIFAPRQPVEFARVLATGGRLLVVTPLADHLIELREALHLLKIDADKEDLLHAALRPHFDLLSRQECQGLLELNAAAVHDIVSMGPNAFHQDSATLTAQIATLPTPYPVTMSVAISVWARGGKTAPQPAIGRELDWTPASVGQIAGRCGLD